MVERYETLSTRKEPTIKYRNHVVGKKIKAEGQTQPQHFLSASVSFLSGLA